MGIFMKMLLLPSMALLILSDELFIFWLVNDKKHIVLLRKKYRNAQLYSFP